MHVKSARYTLLDKELSVQAVAVVLAMGRTVYQYKHILFTATTPNKLIGLEENCQVFFPMKTDRDHLLNQSLEKLLDQLLGLH